MTLNALLASAESTFGACQNSRDRAHGTDESSSGS